MPTLRDYLRLQGFEGETPVELIAPWQPALVEAIRADFDAAIQTGVFHGASVRIPAGTSNQSSNQNAQKREAAVIKQIRELINFVITELNYFIADQGGDAYDYKSEFKSPKQVGLIRTEIIKAYEKDKFRKRLSSFKLSS